MKCGLGVDPCEFDRVSRPEALTLDQRAGLVLCEEHSRRVAAAMEQAERARINAILTTPAPPTKAEIEATILRLCARKGGATYDAMKLACGDRRETYDVFRRLTDDKRIKPKGGRSRGSFVVALPPVTATAGEMTPAPALWGSGGELLLPEKVRLISLDQPYASLLFGNEHSEPGEVGMKSLETRTWPWPYEASWLAIYATRSPDIPAVHRIYGDGHGGREILEHIRDPEVRDLGVVLGVVWVSGFRLMKPEDEKAAMFPYEPCRYVWVLGAAWHLPRAGRIPLPRGPQKFASISRDALAAGFAQAA